MMEVKPAKSGMAAPDDEGDGPVEGDDADPDQFARALVQRRRPEEFHRDVVVQHLDADVAVERRRDQGRDHGQHVAGRLPRVVANPQVRRGLDVLALVGVEEEAVDHVAEVDEELGAPHGLDEVQGPAHLGHEFGEEHGAAVGVHRLHQTVDGGAKVADGRQTAAGDDGGVDAGGVGRHQIRG